MTAIELGADACVLVKATVRGTEVGVASVQTLDPSSFTSSELFTAALRQARRAQGLPRRARVVLWGVVEGARTTDPAAALLLAPLKRAGFRIDYVVSPSNALAALARTRAARHEAAVAWLAVNRAAVAISVIRPGELLYAHAFEWDSSIGATGSQARLLQRYSLVAFLAPEIRRGIEAARAKGAGVDAIVTCGNLPDLRSLTMPLIEELDLEVETLDSLDGLTVKPGLKDGLAESAPTIRIACAGALARAARVKGAPAERPRRGVLFRSAAAALVIAAAAGIGWLWLSGTPLLTRATKPPITPVTKPPITPATPVSKPPITPATPVSKPPTTPTTPVTGPPVTPTTAVTRPPTSQPTAQAASAPAAATVPAKQPPPAPATRTVGAAPPSKPTTPPVAAKVTPGTMAAAPQSQPVPLTDPIPRFTTILVSQERRFAMLEGGRVVTVGDSIGPRVVSAIEPRVVLLREPSGVQIRVGLGGHLIRIEKGR